MADVLKYIAIIVVAAAVIILVSRVFDFLQPGAGDSGIVVVPPDSGFAPVVKQTYRPPSTPFERPEKPVKRLPQGVQETDVKRVITILKEIPIVRGIPDSGRPTYDFIADTTRIVELKSGEILVEATPEISTVTETRYVAPIVAFRPTVGAGISLGPSKDRLVSPSLGLSLVHVLGVIRVPYLQSDLFGGGYGIALSYSMIDVGLVHQWRYDDAGKQIRLMLHYHF